MVTEYGPYHVHLGGHVNRELNHNCEPLGNVGGEYCSAGDIWEYLKTFLVPVTRCMCGRVGGGPTGVLWVKARDVAEQRSRTPHEAWTVFRTELCGPKRCDR